MTSATRSTRTTLRSATSGAPTVSSGPVIWPSTFSTVEEPVAGNACSLNKARRNGSTKTNVAPSRMDDTIVATMLAPKRSL